jgi:hypothetical protein
LAPAERAVIELNQERDSESMAEWLLHRTDNVPGPAEALALQCVQEAAADQDQNGIARWNDVLSAIADLRGRMPASRRLH